MGQMGLLSPLHLASCRENGTIWVLGLQPCLAWASGKGSNLEYAHPSHSTSLWGAQSVPWGLRAVVVSIDWQECPVTNNLYDLVFPYRLGQPCTESRADLTSKGFVTHLRTQSP
jgi:hypothetical protein